MKRLIFLACGLSTCFLMPALHSQMDDDSFENQYLADDEDLDDMDDEFYNPEEEDPAYQDEQNLVDEPETLS